METALFLFYLVAFCIAVVYIPFFKNSGIRPPFLIALFLIKIAAGFAYAKFFKLPQYYPGADTWRFYRQSLIETEWLLQKPSFFFKDLFTHGYGSAGNLFSGENSYWNDLKSNMLVKLIAITNVLTNSNYYAAIIFFNFLFLFGLVALTRLFAELFPGKKLLIITGIFLLPSTLFWCSGVHKDGLILSATGMIIYSVNKLIKQRISIKYLAVILIGSLLIFSLRNYVLFALLPALISWTLSERFPRKKHLIFLSVYFTGILLFFIIPVIIPAVNFPGFVVQKQHEFLLLQGGSKIDVPTLAPSFASFISFFPTAIDMAFLRPHFNEIKNFSYIPAFIEIVILLLLMLYCLIAAKTKQAQPVILFSLFFSLSIMLLAGYTIPFSSAIVRYRSFAWPFLITPLLCLAFRKKSELPA